MKLVPLLLFSAINILLLLAKCSASLSDDASLEITFPTLSLDARSAIDQRALKSAQPNANESRTAWYLDLERALAVPDGLTGWLLSRTPLPPEEEIRRATIVHKEIIRTETIVETPLIAKQILNRLVSTLPEQLRPAETDFTLTVIDKDQLHAFTVGGGHLYITRPYIEVLLGNEKSGHDLLAMVLSNQIGHICREHCRRGYQLLWLQEELEKDRLGKWDAAFLKKLAESVARVSGKLVGFRYSNSQLRDADLFALHLCRNSGFDLENCLDLFRHWVSVQTGAQANQKTKQNNSLP